MKKNQLQISIGAICTVILALMCILFALKEESRNEQ